MIDGQEKDVRLSPPLMFPPGKTLPVLYCGKTTQPLAQPATGRTSGSGIRLYLFLTPAFDPRDVVFLFPAKTCFGRFVTPDVVGAALLTPTPPVPRPPPLPRPHQLKRSCFLRLGTYHVSIVDIGCSFGGLTVALSEPFPDKGVLGMEIRMKVNRGRCRGRVSLAIAHPRRRALNNLVFHRRFCGACVTAHLGGIFHRPVIDLSFEA